MADAIILEFDAPIELYRSVNGLLGLDAETGAGDWPAGMRSHTGSSTDGGGLVVFEVWDSKADQEAFMQDRLGPALHEAGAPQPKRIEWFEVLGHHAD